MPAFTDEEMDGKTVEFETEGMGTYTGTLIVRPIPGGRMLGIHIIGSAGAPPQPLQELTETFENLCRHPFPQRAEFLLLKNEGHILAVLRSLERDRLKSPPD